MTVNQEIVLRFLCSFVSGTATLLPVNMDWWEVIDYATEQGVLGVCFSVIDGRRRVQ